jgi:hypothetical protein
MHVYIENVSPIQGFFVKPWIWTLRKIMNWGNLMLSKLTWDHWNWMVNRKTLLHYRSLLMFQRKVQPPASGWKSKISKEQSKSCLLLAWLSLPEDGGRMLILNSGRLQTTSQGVMSKKIVCFKIHHSHQLHPSHSQPYCIHHTLCITASVVDINSSFSLVTQKPVNA